LIAHRRWHWVGALLLLLLVAVLGVAMGTVRLSVAELLAVLGGDGEELHRTILHRLRGPRVVLAGLVGAGLAMSGATLQGVLRNPLAEPYLLGVSGGAAVGAVLAYAGGFESYLSLGVAAFGGSLLAVAATLGAEGDTGR
jgi:iron complex transport system permease protein